MLVMLRAAAFLNVTRTYGNMNGTSVLGRLAPLDYRIKTISPKPVILLPLTLNESLPAAFRQDSLAGTIMFGRGMLMPGS